MKFSCSELPKSAQEFTNLSTFHGLLGLMAKYLVMLHPSDEIFKPFIKLPFVDNYPPTITKKGARSPMTKGQDWYFENNKLSRDGISKQEASAIIMGHKRANGWKPSKAETVPAGKHEGKYFGEVPPAYWFYLSKNMPKSDAYTSYRSWKASFTK